MTLSLVAHPWAAGLLLLVPLVLWLARRSARPPEVPVGTFALWREFEEVHGAGARVRRHVPAWAWWVAGALLFSALAALGLESGAGRAAQTWTVVVDLSPSMHLEHAGRTRLAAALDAAASVLSSELGPEDRVRWLAPGRGPLELAPRARPPGEWFADARAAGPEPSWDEHDAPATLWVTDRVPAVARAHAWVCASGGPAVAGAIAGDGAALVELDPRGVPRARAEASGAVLSLRGALPPVLARAARAWAVARGYGVGGAAADTVLALEAAGEGAGQAVTLVGGGWRARAMVAPASAPVEPEEELWSGFDEAGREHVALRGGPGHVRVHLVALEEPEGDPAAFALACGRLFDRLALAREEVVPYDERAAAGEPALVRGTVPSAAEERGASGADAALAGAAALCALFALWRTALRA